MKEHLSFSKCAPFWYKMIDNFMNVSRSFVKNPLRTHEEPTFPMVRRCVDEECLETVGSFKFSTLDYGFLFGILQGNI